MTIVIMRDKVKIYKPGPKDKYGEVSGWLVPVTEKARVTEEMRRERNREGVEVSTSLTVLLGNRANVSYEDEIEYVNELGFVIRKRPIRIVPVPKLSGKADHTAVYC